MTKPLKPLGGKTYGSIPHLPGSRLGPADHHCHEGQAIICCEKPRDKHDRIIVTEKLDGSNVCIANINGEIVALTRAGYRAETSPYVQHHLFAEWVALRKDQFLYSLPIGMRVSGEWMAQAHGTRYDLPHGPLVIFDGWNDGKRVPFDWMRDLACNMDLPTAAVLSDGPAFSIDAALSAVSTSRHGALDPVEGAVWRVERMGVFDFLAKYVRNEKKDGCYLPEISGTGESIWNWRPAQ